MFENFKADIARLAEVNGLSQPWSFLQEILFNNGFQAVAGYRLARWFKVQTIPILPMAIARSTLFITGVDISPNAKIGPGLLISHGTGIVVGGAAEIGAGALLLHGVTLGAASQAGVGDMPKVGDRAFLGAHAALIGGIEVGDDVVVGAGAVVTRDVPAGSRVLSSAKAVVDPRPDLPPDPDPPSAGSPE